MFITKFALYFRDLKNFEIQKSLSANIIQSVRMIKALKTFEFISEYREIIIKFKIGEESKAHFIMIVSRTDSTFLSLLLIAVDMNLQKILKRIRSVEKITSFS